MEDEGRGIVRRDFARQGLLGVGALLGAGVADRLPLRGTAVDRRGPSSPSDAAPRAASGALKVTGDASDRHARAAAVQSAIDEAARRGLTRVVVPPEFGPGVDGYDASAVEFHDNVQMVRSANVAGAYDVTAYGAAADYDPGTDEGTDDTVAINAAAEAVRSATAAGRFLGDPGLSAGTHCAAAPLHFPTGFYRCDGGLWLGVDRSSGARLDAGVKHVTAAPGATIVSRNKDGIAVDLSGILGFSCERLTIWGHRTETPMIGLFLARSGPGRPPRSAGEHWFRNVRVIGNFTLASVYNYASEINRWTDCELRNRHQGAECVFYATFDNGTHRVTSANTTTQTDAGQSNFSPTFVNCRFHFDVPGNGTNALFLAESTAGGPKFIACYFDLLQRVDASPPIIRERSGASVNGAPARSSGIVLRDCVIEHDYDSVLTVEGACRGVTIRGCSMGGPPDTADVVVASGATLSEADIQSHRGDNPVDRMTYRLDGKMKRFRNRGAATIRGSTTRVQVTHGMDADHMGLEDVTVTPTGDLGDARSFWIENLREDTFDIRLDAPPGGDGASFVWSAAIG